MNRKTNDAEPHLLRGSVITLKRKCGKRNCACVSRDLHETPALSFSVDGRTRILTLTPTDVPAIRVAVDRYRRAVAELDKEAMRGLVRLERRLQLARRTARRARS